MARPLDGDFEWQGEAAGSGTAVFDALTSISSCRTSSACTTTPRDHSAVGRHASVTSVAETLASGPIQASRRTRTASSNEPVAPSN